MSPCSFLFLVDFLFFFLLDFCFYILWLLWWLWVLWGFSVSSLFFSCSFFICSWVKLSCWSSQSWWPVSKKNSQKYPSHWVINSQPFVSLFPEPFGLLSWITIGSCARTERLQSVGLYRHFHNLRTQAVI